jgi:hypothetical protein
MPRAAYGNAERKVSQLNRRSEKFLSQYRNASFFIDVVHVDILQKERSHEEDSSSLRRTGDDSYCSKYRQC